MNQHHSDDERLMQQALEALETKGEHHPRVYAAITALRERLAEPEQSNGWVLIEGLSDDGEPLGHREPTPQSRQWVGLTDEDKHYLNEVLNLQGRFPIIDAIEAKLREKNT